MKVYLCHTLWDSQKPEVTAKAFENDTEAVEFWVKFAEEHSITACMCVTRLVEVDGFEYDDFVAMFRPGVNGLGIIKSKDL